jgi:hypothetical protein
MKETKTTEEKIIIYTLGLGELVRTERNVSEIEDLGNYVKSEALQGYILRANRLNSYILSKEGKVMPDFTLNFDVTNILSENIYVNYVDNVGNIYNSLLYDEELFNKFDIQECVKQGIYVHKTLLDKYNKTKTFPKFNEFKNPFSRLVNKTTKLEIELGSKSSSYTLTEGLKYTFGVELECADGVIPMSVVKKNKLNISIEKDGSILNTKGEKYGPEIITGVLIGDAGFNQLRNICNTLVPRTAVNSTCGLHVHCGGLSFTNNFVVAAYKLGYKLQDEIFSTLPKSRRDNAYCFRLNDLNINFNNLESPEDYNYRLENYYNQIFRLLCGQNPNRKANKLTNHPAGAKAGYNHSNIRYSWLNFLPSMFNTKGDKINPVYTLEFRNHSGTTNFVKVKNWVLLCMAFCYVADNYSKNILEDNFDFRIENILRLTYPKTYSELLSYIEERKYKFKTLEIANEAEELEDNSQYKNDVKTIKGIF